jgi:ABC-type branched-subunit amino acid transport system ATPase component
MQLTPKFTAAVTVVKNGKEIKEGSKDGIRSNDQSSKGKIR